MNYVECLDYLYNKLPMFSKLGHAALKIDLSNTISICRGLDNPEKKIKTVHIAGTNGKGSVSHMLAAIFQTAGYKTGLYTSPHLKDFRERIKIGGLMIPEQRVIEYTELMMPLIEELDPSFFEVTVGMAFKYFADEHVDIAIIETGLGGRLDSTNVILPELSIITNIGFDHEQILGNTLEKIAGEKAGIIKHDIPVVVGRTDLKTKKVFIEKAEKENAPIYFADQDWHTEVIESHPHTLLMRVWKPETQKSMIIESELPGLYQAENIRTTLAGLTILSQRGWKIQEKDILSGIQNVKTLTGLGGRWEVIQKDPLLILDVAHNEDGIKNVLQQINSVQHEQLFIILGMSKEKDVRKVVELLPKRAIYSFTKADIPRALEIKDLETIAAEAGLTGRSYENVNIAINECLKRAQMRDLIVVCGSIFVVGEVDRDALLKT